MSRDNEGARCESCTHWHEVPRLDAGDRWTEGQCRRRAPAPVLGHTVPYPEGVAGLEVQRAARLAVSAVWPLTEQDQWCSEWQPSEVWLRARDRSEP